VAHRLSSERFIIVLDEFPYLCADNPGLPSVVQGWWDTMGKVSKLFVVLCGSHIGFMEREILGERSALFGRRTAQDRLGPLLPWDAARFFPKRPARERLAAFGILGGVPAYLERMRSDQPLRANLLREAFDPRGFLFDEVPFLLRTELAQPRTYLSILKAISGGATRMSEIASKAGIPVTSATVYLRTLSELGLVDRAVPFIEQDPVKSRRGIYAITDPFVAFWCRFVLPHQSLIQAGHGETVLENLVEPGLDAHLARVFEDVCRTFVLHRGDRLMGSPPLKVGRLWGADMDIDVLAKMRGGEILVGECKWSRSPVGLDVLAKLEERAGMLPGALVRGQRLALFSASGFTPEVIRQSKTRGVLLVDGDDLVRG
jgi:AAA+ ATPase superfamily predicted ATPase